MSEVAYLALGSNLGNRGGFLASARAAISLIPGCHIVAATPVEETAPFGYAAQGPYFNQMLALRTILTPAGLLDRLQAIEQGLGRVRVARWGPRTIDLDIVRFGSVTFTSEHLTVPHPGFHDRTFWQRQARLLDSMLVAG